MRQPACPLLMDIRRNVCLVRGTVLEPNGVVPGCPQYSACVLTEDPEEARMCCWSD